MKAEYERTNGTIEGLRDRDEPEIEDQEGEEDENGDDDDDDEGKGDKPKEPKELSIEKSELLHYSGDYLCQRFRDEVKLDSKGRAYKVGSDGRKSMPSKRPSRYITPEEWKKMSLKEREASTKAADDIAREEAEEEDRIAKKKSKKKRKKRRIRRKGNPMKKV